MSGELENEKKDVFLERRNITTKEELVYKLTPLFETFETLFNPIAHFNDREDGKSQQPNNFFNEWQDFFDNKIEFFSNSENIFHLTEFGEKYKEDIIKNLIYYRDLLVTVASKLEGLEFISDSELLNEVEEDLDKYQAIFSVNFKQFVDAGLENPFLIKRSSFRFKLKELDFENLESEEETSTTALIKGTPPVLYPFIATASKEENTAEFSCSIKDSFREKIEKTLKEYEEYLSSYNFNCQSSRSRFYLVTKRGAVSNLLFSIKHNTFEDFKFCLFGWKSTFEQHRDNFFIQAIGSFFKQHTKTKGSLLLEKLESLIEQAEIAVNPQPNL